MGLHIFKSTGVRIDYFPSITGNLDHIVIKLEYNDKRKEKNLMDLAPLFNEKSLAETREFLRAHNVTSIEINLPENFGEDVPDHILKTYENLGKRLGQLIKSIPSIKNVYIDKINEDPFLKALKKFEDNLCEELQTSLAHPSVFFQVTNKLSIDNKLPSMEGSLQAEYEDKRSAMQKKYAFFSSIPFLGLLIRAIASFFYGDSEKKYFADSSSRISDIDYTKPANSDSKKPKQTEQTEVAPKNVENEPKLTSNTNSLSPSNTSAFFDSNNKPFHLGEHLTSRTDINWGQLFKDAIAPYGDVKSLITDFNKYSKSSIHFVIAIEHKQTLSFTDNPYQNAVQFNTTGSGIFTHNKNIGFSVNKFSKNKSHFLSDDSSVFRITINNISAENKEDLDKKISERFAEIKDIVTRIFSKGICKSDNEAACHSWLSNKEDLFRYMEDLAQRQNASCQHFDSISSTDLNSTSFTI